MSRISHGFGVNGTHHTQTEAPISLTEHTHTHIQSARMPRRMPMPANIEHIQTHHTHIARARIKT